MSGAPGEIRTPDLLVRSQFLACYLALYRLVSLGFQDNTVDERENTRIMKSSLFTVSESLTPSLVMEMPINQEIVDRALGDKVGAITVPMRVALLLLPSSVTPEQISKISDAERLGGSVMTVNGFPLPLMRKKIAVRKPAAILRLLDQQLRRSCPRFS